MAARVASAMQLSSNRPYQAEDEIFDRLTLIVGELGFKYANCNVGNIAAFSDGARPMKIATSAPWEVHALCHHSRLMAFLLDPDSGQGSEEIETFNDRLSHFLNTEGTLVACWERAYSKASRGWLRSETTAVVASTIISVLAQQIDPRKTTTDPPAGEHKTSDPVSMAGSVFRGQFQQPEKTLCETSSPPPIEWATVFAPPKKYHPDAFVLSLSDTRYAYRKKVLQKRIAIPSTLEHFGSECPPKFTKETLQEALEQSLRSVIREYLFHIVTPPKPWWVRDYNVPPGRNRTPGPSQDQFECALQDIIRSSQGHNLPPIESHERELRDYANFISVTDIVDSVVDRDVKGFSGLKESARYLDSNSSPQVPNLVLDRLSRSLVDQDVQHRFLKMARLPKELMGHLIYVLHPEVVTGLNHHVLSLSRFLCQKRSTWISTITLKAWSVKRSDMSFNAGMIPQVESTGTAKLLCQGEFKQVNSKVQHENMNIIPLTRKSDIVQRLSTITMSTNFSGDFSKCTIISNLLEDKHISETANRIRSLWQQFVHRPQTARCLAFLLILRELSKVIRKEYRSVVEEINKEIVSNKVEDEAQDSLEWLRNRFFLRGDKLDAELPEAFGGSNVTKYLVQSLRRHTLHTIQLALNECVDSIMQAKQELLAQVREDQASLSPLLDRMCHEYLELVEDEFSQVAALGAQLDWVVQSTNRSMDVFSIVTSMVDSQTSLQQNRTIQKLTYVTIGYLPVGLITAILAIPKEQEVVFQPFGLKYYLTALASLFIVTCIVAVKVDSIVPFLSGGFMQLLRALTCHDSVKRA
ncbi:Magnesium transport protein CorA [Madurella mycetomatis]|uniref:Magnesium transport protein CorA n=2 Tax=Madurella mycetomatis TaxID=100816 RepID=A0A175VQD0_9PEZI|nr:Magnesium transport protein CorA [Madurella mycetomatis]